MSIATLRSPFAFIPRPFRRTAIAAALVAIAVLVPSTFWYLSGTAEADRRAARHENDAAARAQRTADQEAARLSTRLETLRAAETVRPFYHYQNLYHDPRGATQGLAVVPSPLASGAPDPLIWAHFQIDPLGRVSLPTVNEQFPELSAEQGFAVYCSFLEALRGAVVVPPPNEAAGAHESAGRAADQTSRLDLAEPRVVVFDEEAWQQHLRADDVYARITGRQETLPGRSLPGAANGSAAPVVVREGPLLWRTMIIDRGPLLAAVREVETPSGTLVQGFALATEGVIAWLGAAAQALELAASPSVGPHLVTSPIGRTGWWLNADAARPIADARAAGRLETRDFRRRFLAVGTATLVAALALIIMVAHADRLAAQRARFAAAAAHELKTPLSSLRLFSEMLSERLGDPQKTRTYASRIASDVTRLGRVVSNMLDLARLERGADLVEPRAGDIATSIADCVDRLRPGLEASGLEVRLVIEPMPTLTIFDPDATCQIIHNLLDNAEKHTRSAEQRAVEISLRLESGQPVLRVADTGEGVPRRLATRIFEPFTRGHDAPGTSGLGLGLPLSRALARAQGGDLVLDRKVLPGACFKLLLAPDPGSSRR